jgi:N-alpha-acetyltransferase 10/11
MAEFTLLPSNLRDLSALRSLEKECFEKDAWPLIDLIGVLTFPGIVRVKAVAADQMVGFAAGEIHSDNQMGWVTTIGVTKAYRNMGVATALLGAVEIQLHTECVRLSVRKSNSIAIQLYLKRGYKQVGNWPGYYEDGEDASIFEKSISGTE